MRIGDDSCQVVRRILAPLGGERAEILKKSLDSLCSRIESGFLNGHFGIVGAKQHLRQLQHFLVVLTRNAEDHHDHAQRIPDPHVSGEIALASHLLHAVDEFLRQQSKSILELPEVGRHKPCLALAAAAHASLSWNTAIRQDPHVLVRIRDVT